MSPAPGWRPRLVALDLDGTVLRDDKTVSPRTRAALRACREAGIALCVASARGASSIGLTVPPELSDALRVAHNGALAVLGGEVLHHEPLPPGALEACVAFAHGFDPPLLHFAELEDRPTASRDVRELWGVGFAVRDFRGLPAGTEVAKVLLQWPAGQELSSLAGRLPAGTELLLDRDGYVHAQRSGVSKHRALEACLTRLGLSWEDVAAFGDDHTDAGMLDRAGLGVAMGNAVPAALEAADRVAPTNQEDGVAAVLEALLGR